MRRQERFRNFPWPLWRIDMLACLAATIAMAVWIVVLLVGMTVGFQLSGFELDAEPRRSAGAVLIVVQVLLIFGGGTASSTLVSNWVYRNWGPDCHKCGQRIRTVFQSQHCWQKGCPGCRATFETMFDDQSSRS